MFCVKFIFIDNNICLGLCGRSANLLLNECFPQFHLGVTNSIESHFAEYTFILIRWPIINMGGWWGLGVRVLRKKNDGGVRDPGFRNYTLSYGDRGPKSCSWLRKMGQSQTLDNRKSHQTNNFWSVHHIYIKFKTDRASSFTLLGQSSDTNCCFGLGLWSCFCQTLVWPFGCEKGGGGRFPVSAASQICDFIFCCHLGFLIIIYPCWN